ncbi:hypothetical protein GCM10010468_22540 [Actinocorallia longicatena]|uniref:MFS transporter n=1 Tax=Actinocorallia longicatena TaxID=111803 RepID=A0ABP6QC44_9ACTN
MIAAVLAGPRLGAWVDHRPARRTIRDLQIALAVVTAALVWYQPVSYLLLLTLKALLAGAQWSAFNRLMPAVVPDGRIGRGMGLLGTVNQTAAGLGMALGPYLAARLGPKVFLLDAAAFLVASLLYRRIRTDVAPAASADRRVRAAFPRLFGDPFHRAVLGLFLLGQLVWGMRDIGILPLVRDVLRLDTAHWTGLFAAVGLCGEVVATAVFAWRDPRPGRAARPWLAALTVLLAVSVALPVMATGPAVPAKFLDGVASCLLGGGAMLVLVMSAPPDLRGRTAALVGGLGMAVLAGSKLVLGLLMARYGVVPVYETVAVLVVVAALALAVPAGRSWRRATVVIHEWSRPQGGSAPVSADRARGAGVEAGRPGGIRRPAADDSHGHQSAGPGQACGERRGGLSR